MWILITEKDHIKVESLEEGTKLLTKKARELSPNLVKLITLEEYNQWDGRKRKRGKKSI